MNIVRPTLVLNKTACLQNIELMAEKAKRHKLRFRPHFKTHQSIEIGRWFRNYDVEHITVSSVQMATYFASDGWQDITIAFPFNTHEINDLNKISANTKINIVVDNPKTIELIHNKIQHPLDVYIKVSTGYNRVGIASSSYSQIEKLLGAISEEPKLNFKGFISHAGHAYETTSRNEIQNVHFDAVLKLNRLKNYFIRRYPNLELSVGDTPSCSISEYFKGIDEIRPGNFIFNDLVQNNLGVCNIDDIAVRMHCPVISKQQDRNEVIIYGGAVHFSKDHIQNIDGKALYGRIILNTGDEKKLLNPKNYLIRLSQEHGIIRLTNKIFNKVEIGDIIEIIPAHSCLTASCMRGYITHKGEHIEMM
ncbi:MAG: alanine racemase [Prolixibacteraceae bacterium]|jgi:D-serine deaminase-like pyridoxal phosphate-dependent protein|nr:alanine racemase [Prolixibacteraceae bacterium]